jgi:hypothetical protein
MRRLRERDTAAEVLMVQVENEVGYVGVGGRGRSEAANKLFHGPTPKWIEGLSENSLTTDLTGIFNPVGRTWKEMFGEAADEVFMAWEYGTHFVLIRNDFKTPSCSKVWALVCWKIVSIEIQATKGKLNVNGFISQLPRRSAPNRQ